jgi:iron complex outermembrane receptor protein
MTGVDEMNTGRARKRLKPLLMAGIAAMAAGTAPALAWGQVVQTTGGLKDVVVTATRQTTRLQKTPVAVTVVNAKEISEQHLTTARDLAGKTPGVTIIRSGITPLTQVFYIRGIGDSDPIFDPNIAQYIDDVYLPRAINGLSDLTDLERVEILRGPQGTLFGENADAGAIRYITKEPTDTTEGNFDIGGGTYGAFQAHGYIAGPIIPGVLDGSIAFAHDTHQGYTYDPTIGKHVNNQDSNGARGKLLATITPNLTVELEADGVLDNSATDYYVPVYPITGGNLKKPIYGKFDPNDSYASQDPKNDSFDGGVSLKIAYAINPHLTFKSISAYRGFSQNPVNYNNDGEPLVDYSPADPVPVSLSDNFIVYREQELSQEFQLLGNYDNFDFASGLYLLHENFASNRIGYVVSPTAATATPSYPEDQIGDTKTTDYAAYTQADYHFTDKLIGTLGGRYTIENRGFTFQGIYDTLGGVPLPVTPGSYAAKNNFTYLGDKTWYSFTPKYGLSYQFTPGIYGYATIAEGFDAGGFNNRASSLATALPYDQENVTTYETGLKTDWFGHRLRVNGDLFYNDYKGLQQTAEVLSPITDALVSVRANAGNAHTDGFELETTAEPLDGLLLTGNASYLWTRFDSFPAPGTSVNTGKPVSATGNQLPFAPRWQLYGAANYTVPVDLYGTLKLGGDVSYETSYFSDVFNYPQGEIHPQAFADAFISFAPDNSRWTATITGQNLFNRLAFQSLTWAGTKNEYYGPVSPPQTFFFKLGYTY